MSMDCGGLEVWGICIDPDDGNDEAALFAQLNEMLKVAEPGSKLADLIADNDDARKLVLDWCRDHELGPSDDMDVVAVDGSSPGRSDTPPGSIVVGYMTTTRDPTSEPVKVSEDFRRAAAFWNWVWCG